MNWRPLRRKSWTALDPRGRSSTLWSSTIALGELAPRIFERIFEERDVLQQTKLLVLAPLGLRGRLQQLSGRWILRLGNQAGARLPTCRNADGSLARPEHSYSFVGAFYPRESQ